MSLCISLTKVLVDPKSVHLGALGTHFLEHFFGMVRRFCHGDDFVSSFQSSIENIIILKLIQHENNYDISKQPGRSDSGSRLKEENRMIKEVPLKVSMWRAAEILLTVGELLNSTLNDAVNEHYFLFMIIIL